MNYFWLLWGFDAIIALVVMYFLIIGLTDGSVSSQNMFLWLVIVVALIAILGGSYWLKTSGHMTAAKSVLYILAIPGLLYTLFLVIAIFSKARWN